MVLPFFLPLKLIALIAGPEEAKKLAGKYPRPDSWSVWCGILLPQPYESA